MSRRLGEDPLVRARNRTAGAPTTAKAPTSEGAVPSRKSFNDVFFERRTQEGNPTNASKQQDVTEAEQTREISEISEIPALREISTVVGERTPTKGSVEDAKDQEVFMVSSPENAATIVSEVASGAKTGAESVLDDKEEQSGHPAAFDAPVQEGEQSRPEKNGGFLRRLFGRLGK